MFAEQKLCRRHAFNIFFKKIQYMLIFSQYVCKNTKHNIECNDTFIQIQCTRNEVFICKQL